MRALIVDDDELSLDLLQNLLQQTGYEVEIARNGREAMNILRQGEIRLLVTDWEMPEMNGIELCQAVRTEDLAGYVYIIMVTGRDSPQQKIEGLYAGADNFITKPLNTAELLVCLKTADRILSLETRDLAMFAMAKLAESRDPETGLHIERVQSYVRLLAQHLSTIGKYRAVIDADYVRLIYQTSPLHDVGKVGIPDPVLLKPGKLTPQETLIMRTHTTLGAQTLDAALQRFPGARFLQMARDIAASHHEKFDGTGYPEGLAGHDIPLCGRIVALADVYDALTSRRVYKQAMSHVQARQIIVAESGSHFDPDMVNAFLACEERFISVKERLADTEPTAEAPPEPVLSLPAQSEPELLVVEDDAAQREHVCGLLRTAAYEVKAAATVAEAQTMLAQLHPRVMLADWVLPDGSGLDLCKQIRGSEDLRHTHIIMMTIRCEKRDMVEAFDAGVDDFIAKPFDETELLARIRAAMRVVSLHDELARKNLGSKELNLQLAGLNNRLEKLAITDDLTGLFNRRHAMARLEEQWSLGDRYPRPLSVALVDIDHFKRVNDTYGHAAGDGILREVAQVLRRTARSSDTVCRVGGEEFLIIFPAQTIDEGEIFAERLRSAVASNRFAIGELPVGITVSVGVSGRRTGLNDVSELMKEADQALYAAKAAGRNAVRRGDKLPPASPTVENPVAA